MEGKKAAAILMGLYGLFGIGTGLIFGRAQYHKGQADAYDDIAENLKEISDEIEKSLEEKEEA